MFTLDLLPLIMVTENQVESNGTKDEIEFLYLVSPFR